MQSRLNVMLGAMALLAVGCAAPVSQGDAASAGLETQHLAAFCGAPDTEVGAAYGLAVNAEVTRRLATGAADVSAAMLSMRADYCKGVAWRLS
jgi:type IV pilus biogenesis protein CpaD/CtpE